MPTSTISVFRGLGQKVTTQTTPISLQVVYGRRICRPGIGCENEANLTHFDVEGKNSNSCFSTLEGKPVDADWSVCFVEPEMAVGSIHVRSYMYLYNIESLVELPNYHKAQVNWPIAYLLGPCWGESIFLVHGDVCLASHKHTVFKSV